MDRGEKTWETHDDQQITKTWGVAGPRPAHQSLPAMQQGGTT